MTDSAHHLDYAGRPAWHRRSRLRRTLLLGMVLLVGLVSLPWLRAGWEHSKLLYWQGKCLRQETSSAQPIDPYQAPANPAWMAYYALLSPPGRRPAPTVLLHEMRPKHGDKRLVAIEAALGVGSSPHKELSIRLEYHVIVPAGAWSRPRLVGNRTWYCRAWAAPRWIESFPAGEIKLYPAKLDAADPSHFTIRLEPAHGPESRLIDGWLMPDDSVLLEVRSDPLLQAAAGR